MVVLDLGCCRRLHSNDGCIVRALTEPCGVQGIVRTLLPLRNVFLTASQAGTGKTVLTYAKRLTSPEMKT